MFPSERVKWRKRKNPVFFVEDDVNGKESVTPGPRQNLKEERDVVRDTVLVGDVMCAGGEQGGSRFHFYFPSTDAHLQLLTDHPETWTGRQNRHPTPSSTRQRYGEGVVSAKFRYCLLLSLSGRWVVDVVRTM